MLASLAKNLISIDFQTSIFNNCSSLRSQKNIISVDFEIQF